MKSTGYSRTPLEKKLGYKEGIIIKLVNEPPYYFSLFNSLPENIKNEKSPQVKKDLIHVFFTEMEQLHSELSSLKNEIKLNGIIWVSWYKKASKIPTDITEDVIRNFALLNGLVDVKVCSIDNLWSGLKLVIPVSAREL